MSIVDEVEVIDNERYNLVDIVDKAERFTISVTNLKSHQSTRGNIHSEPEIYYFLGECKLLLDGVPYPMASGSMFVVPPDVHHQVMNSSDGLVTFLTLFSGTRSQKHK